MCMQKKSMTVKTFDNTLFSESEVLQRLQQSIVSYCRYQQLQEDWQRRFLDFCMGKKTLPLTYDPFFKRMFHPDIHPERLSRFLSDFLGQNVKIVRILPTEETLLDGGALLIMDILVELENGSLANIEVQKVPYDFPGERMSCYSADLLLRQYARVKGDRGKDFTYSDIKKVYTIIFFEKTPAIFHTTGNNYIHKGKTTFNTGLPLELLQEYCLIALDVFREIPYAKGEDNCTAWVGLLATENLEDAGKLIADYPWLSEIYQEMAGYMYKPEEVLIMFSEALKMIDHNTVQYMIEKQAEQIESQFAQIESQAVQIESQTAQIESQAVQIESQTAQIESQAVQIESQTAQIESQAVQIESQTALLQEKEQLLAEQAKLIASLQQQLGN